jgi:archaellum component FlaC
MAKTFNKVLENAALEDINEDIHAIVTSLEKINNDIPSEVKKQLAEFSLEVSALSNALKSVPEQFDLDFTKKMHRILDIVSDIQDINNDHKNNLVSDLKSILNDYIDTINIKLSKKINDSFIIKKSTFSISLFWAALLGGLISASCVSLILFAL